MTIEEKAIKYITIYHRGLVRKSNPDIPMAVHLVNTRNILYSYNYDENVRTTGYLHDVVEDTKVTLQDVAH